MRMPKTKHRHIRYVLSGGSTHDFSLCTKLIPYDLGSVVLYLSEVCFLCKRN